MKTVFKGTKTMRAAVAALTFCALFVPAASAAEAGHYYYDGGQRRALLLDETLLAEFGKTPNAVKTALPGTRAAKIKGGVTIYHVSAVAAKTVLDVAPQAAVSPVFREGGSPAGRLMALPGGVLVNFKADWSAEQVNAWAAAKELMVGKKLDIGQNWYVIKSSPGQAALDLANTIQQSGEVVSATPNWWKEVSTR